MNGKAPNSSPDLQPSRWIINFFDWSLESCDHYPLCLDILRERVRPQRSLLPDSKRRVRQNWWRYEFEAADLYVKMRSLDRIIAIARISKTVQPVLLQTG